MTHVSAKDGIQDRPSSWKFVPGSLRELFAVAVPLVLSSGSLAAMNVIDRIFLTRYSTDALAASTPSGILHWTVMSLVIGTASCVASFVAQYEGAGRKHRVGAVVWQGVYLSFTAGLLFLAVVPLSPRIFAWAGHAPAVQKLEVAYFSVLCYGAVPMTLCTVLSGFFSGRGQTMVIMWVNLALACINVGLDWLLIFGRGPLPELGVRGAAISTICAYVIAAAVYFALMGRPTVQREYGIYSAMRFDRELFGRLLKFGLPTGGQYLIDLLAFTLFLFLVGRLGPVAQQATNLAFNLNGMAFVPLMGLGTAVMTLVGRRIGEGRPELAVRSTWLAALIGSLWIALFGAMYLFVPERILAVYAGNLPPDEFQPLVETTVVLLRYVTIFLFFDALTIVFSAAVRGAGDTRFPLYLMLFTSWFIMFLPVVVADALGRNTLTFSWVCCTVSIVISGLGIVWRFQAGHWKLLKMIESDPATELPPVPPALPHPLADPPIPIDDDFLYGDESVSDSRRTRYHNPAQVTNFSQSPGNSSSPDYSPSAGNSPSPGKSPTPGNSPSPGKSPSAGSSRSPIRRDETRTVDRNVPGA